MQDVILHDPSKEINELRNQLSYSKRMGFFCGAGVSKAVGISDISELTTKIKRDFSGKKKASIDKIIESVNEELQGNQATVEDILNRVRLIRQITLDKENKNFDGIDGLTAKGLDKEICDKIYEIVSGEEKKADLTHMQNFVMWMNWLSRDFPKEVFTTNYDLLFERAFERLQIPYYDGFVGANEPFFLPESLDGDVRYDKPPLSWIRLWKIHGSLGWFWMPGTGTRSYRIVRLGVGAKEFAPDRELVIYPSREKYESSRKQPFIAYLDRLRSFLLDGEGLFIVAGYSFSDQHINSILFDGLKQNPRLHMIGFFYSDKDLEKLNEAGNCFPNFSAYGPRKAIVTGLLGNWQTSKIDELLTVCWNEKESQFTLGDFKNLVRFLILSSGKQEKIESEVKERNEK